MYILKPISNEIRRPQQIFHHYSNARKLILISIFAGIAAILQSAGGFLPGIGYFLSALATAPILLSSMLSIPYGLMSYFLTMMLLLILQPTELIIFPFTTGLLGLGIGIAFTFFRKRISIIIAGAISLMLGIVCLLYLFQFPILGPIVSHSFSFLAAGGIFLFAFFYSWLWVEMALIIFKRLKMIIN